MVAENELGSRRWLILLSAVASFFAVGVTFFAIPPLRPELVELFGLNHLQIGILMGAIAVPAIFLSIPLGSALDRWPLRASGNAGLGLMVAGSVIFAAAPSFSVLLIGRLLFGLGGLILNLLLARLIAAAFAERELAFAMGVFNAIYPAAMIVMFTIHPTLMEAFGWRGELRLLVVMTLIAIPLHNVAVPRGYRASEPVESGPVEVPITGPLVGLAASWMLFFAVFTSVLTFAPEWAGGGSRSLLMVSAITWVALFLNPVVGVLIDRMGRAWLFAMGGQLLLCATLVGMIASRIPVLPAMLLMGIGAAAVSTATYALPSRMVSAAQIGFAFGLITAFSNLGTIAGPAICGALRDVTGGWLAPWLVLAGAALVGAAAVPRVLDRGPY